MRETHKHQRTPGNQTILMGDLNSSWLDSDKGGTHLALHRWANQMGWCNPSRTITDHLQSAKIRTKWTSITPVSWIDHSDKTVGRLGWETDQRNRDRLGHPRSSKTFTYT